MKRRGERWFYGIHWKMFLCLTAVSVGLLLVVATSINIVMRHYLQKSALEKYKFSNEILEQHMTESFSKLEQETESFMFDTLIQRSLERTPLTFLEQNKISNVWNRIGSKYVRNGIYIDNKGNSYTKGNKSFDFPYDAYEASDLAQAKNNSYGKLQWLWKQDFIFGTEENSIFLIRNVRNVEKPEQAGILLLQLETHFMDYSVEQAETSENLYYYLFDEQGRLCYEKNGDMRSEIEQEKQIRKIVATLTFQERQGTIVTKTEDGILFSCYEPNSCLTIVTEVPNQTIYKVSRTVGTILLVLAGVMILIAAAVSIGLSYYFTRPIHEISKIMEQFDGSSFDNQLSIATNTELDVIGDAYNRMLERMKLLVTEIRKKEKEVWELTLDSMYYQLNPHFLYNTLDNIYMIARIEEQKDIMNMIHALSTLLKISLNKGNGNVSVAQELEHAVSYLEIQKIRFGGRFRYQIQCEEEVKERQILKLILQPIVENSVKYGFVGMDCDGLILIQVKKEGDRIYFSVYNNGKSIAKERVMQMNRIKEMTQEEMKQNFFTEKGGFGIYNIVTRMRMVYGEAFDIQYSIPEGGGTLCCIWLP